MVFRELREARSLAYANYVRYALGSRAGEQNQMVAIVLCQAGKTAEAVGAPIDLIDNLPISEERFAISKEAVINRYKTAKVGFREVIGAVLTGSIKDWKSIYVLIAIIRSSDQISTYCLISTAPILPNGKS